MSPLNEAHKFGDDAELVLPKSGPALEYAFSNGAIPAAVAAYITAKEYGNGVIHKTILTCTALPITITDEATVGQYGGVQVYDFPVGLIATLAVVTAGTVTAVAPIIDEWQGDFGLGEVVQPDHTNGLLATILQSAVLDAPAASKVSPADSVSVATDLTESGARWADGTTTAINLFLNMLIDDNAAHVGAMSVAFTGTITITWIPAGDN